ncbi:MAG: 4-(cytidine 5'-diphospho)-2-C-methyl-D-erythritol kinase [Pseudomonadota bacterium]
MHTGEVAGFAPAKVNLSLHVTGQRDDGYHLLDSLVAFADIGDQVTVSSDAALSLTIDGPEAAGLFAEDDNLVLRAARFLDPGRGARIRLTKHLPVASGIGGGSADAAATIRALCALWQQPLPAPHRLAALGADVPVCLHGKPCRMRGIGDDLEAIPDLPPLDVLLVNPRVSVPTAAVFAGLASRHNPPMTDPPPADHHGFLDWLKEQRNDLAAPAIAYAPEIEKVLQELEALKPLHCAMSGSGATCFALFPKGTTAAQAERSVAAVHPQWWVASGGLH